MSQIFTELQQVIAQRAQQTLPGSYTHRLLLEGTLAERKVSEEAYELIEAAFKGDQKAILYEAADLIYHFMVLLHKHGISLQELEQELINRRKAS